MVFLLLVVALAAFALFNAYRYLTRKNVSGKKVLITGAASGIGRQMAIQFAKKHAHLILWDVDREGLKSTAAEVSALLVTCETAVVDVSDRPSVQKAATELLGRITSVDILINNAGIVQGKKFLSDSWKEEDALRTMRVNTFAHFWTCKAFLPKMMELNSGHVVTIASVVGLPGASPVGLSDYSASKAAVISFAEAVRRELHAEKKFGVKTTIICPAHINTPLFTGLRVKFPWLVPTLTQEYVASSVLSAVLENRELVILPTHFHYLYPVIQSILPVAAVDAIFRFVGAEEAMDFFVGRKDAVKKNE